MMARVAALFLAVLTGWAACRPTPRAARSRSETAELAAREQRLATRLANTGAERNEPVARWILPPDLGEISGLATTPDGRLLAHNDERGRISVIDPKRGALLKRFSIGATGGEAQADFEGITVADNHIYLLTSNGVLYEFEEGEDGERVRYTVHDTRLGNECEFEGVAFDPGSGSLLLSCKSVGTKDLRDQLVIYRWNLQTTDASRLSTLAIPLARVSGSNGWKSLHPSDITVDPPSGNYVLVASKENALVEITPSGDVLRSRPLPGKHRQPEGVAITSEGILIIGDEGANRSATITLYRWPLSAPTQAFP